MVSSKKLVAKTYILPFWVILLRKLVELLEAECEKEKGMVTST